MKKFIIVKRFLLISLLLISISILSFGCDRVGKLSNEYKDTKKKEQEQSTEEQQETTAFNKNYAKTHDSMKDALIKDLQARYQDFSTEKFDETIENYFRDEFAIIKEFGIMGNPTYSSMAESDIPKDYAKVSENIWRKEVVNSEKTQTDLGYIFRFNHNLLKELDDNFDNDLNTVFGFEFTVPTGDIDKALQEGLSTSTSAEEYDPSYIANIERRLTPNTLITEEMFMENKELILKFINCQCRKGPFIFEAVTDKFHTERYEDCQYDGIVFLDDTAKGTKMVTFVSSQLETGTMVDSKKSSTLTMELEAKTDENGQVKVLAIIDNPEEISK